MAAPYTNRRIGIYAVELTVACSLETCLAESMATVRAGSCEDARTGVMRVLRYRGWQVGKHAPTLCDKHAPRPIKCVRCREDTPPFYIDKVGDIPFREEAVPELAKHSPRDPLCHDCRRWARTVVYAWHRSNYAERVAAEPVGVSRNTP